MRLLGIPAAAVLAAVLIALPAPQVSAGLFDSIFSPGPQKPQVVGRHLVSVPPGYKPGTIFVQFSRARLYYILSSGRAISYPIAAPKGEARWSGETYVSDKRVNPGWRRLKCAKKTPNCRPMCREAIRAIRWGSGPSISARASTASTAQTRHGPLDSPFPTAASACSTKTSPICISGFR